jgi:voltage-gated potassium channel
VRGRDWPVDEAGVISTEAQATELRPAAAPWRRRAYQIIFEHDTRAGRLFDQVLLALILLSVLAVMLETVPSIGDRQHTWLRQAEFLFTIVFTVEYALRLAAVDNQKRYVLSFFGIVDLIAILPTYVSLFLPGAQSLLVIRGLRLLRMFRVLKLAHMAGEGQALAESLQASRSKIVVFLVAVSVSVTIMGAAMYLIEGRFNPAFRSIPDGMYWAIVTMATVGYGDAVPTTAVGKVMTAVIILFGYSLIVVPTGIFSAEIARRAARGALQDASRALSSAAGADRRRTGPEAAADECRRCGRSGHAADARFCDRCGTRFDPGEIA